MTYGEEIRKGREKQHLTQEDLAERLGVSRQAVSKWEADKSRPAAAKLAALSEALDISEEIWAAIDAENRAVPPEPVRSSRRWKTITVALAVLLLLSLFGSATLFWKLKQQDKDIVPAQEEPAELPLMEPSDISQVFPETLVLEYERDYDFGDKPIGTYDPALVPFLKDETKRQEQELWGGYFGDETQIPDTFLSVVKTNPVEDNGTTFWDVYLLYAVADENGTLDWDILLRIGEENHFVNEDDGLFVEEFTNVLGRDGFKISLALGVGGTSNFYISLRPDNTPCMMAAVGGSSLGAVEFDVDEDGVQEIICPGGLPMYWTIYDTKPGEEGAFLYTLNSMECGVTNIHFDPDKGGFVVADSQENVMVRYAFLGDEMVRLPMTDFTALDYPDVAGTKLTFDLDYFYDSVDPDTVLYTENGTRLTPRQQAYLALQELYDLTGLKVEESYCAVSGIGSVCFSMLPDGLNERCFYSVCLPETYGGLGIPNLYLVWNELGMEWSPLQLSEMRGLEGLQTKHRLDPAGVLSWYYDRLQILHSGEAAYTNGGDLWLTNGDCYVGELQDTEYGPALVSLYGPYPNGEINH